MNKINNNIKTINNNNLKTSDKIFINNLIIQTIIFILFLYTNQIKKIIFGFTFGICTLTTISLLYINTDSIKNNIDPIFNPNKIFSGNKIDDTSSEYYRLLLMKASIDRIEGKRWIYGFGPNAFYRSNVTAYYDGVNHILTAPDNQYIKFLFENGMLGILTIIILLFSIVKKNLQIIKISKGSAKVFAVACFASITGFIILNTTVSYFQMYPLGTIFWLVVAKMTTLEYEKNKK